MKKNGEVENCSQNSTEEFIDFVDVTAFLWRIKYFALFGSISGFFVTMWIQTIQIFPKYYSAVPLLLNFVGDDYNISPIEKINALVSTGELREILNKYGVQTSPENSGFRIQEKATGIELVLGLQAKDVSGEISLKIANEVFAKVFELNTISKQNLKDFVLPVNHGYVELSKEEQKALDEYSRIVALQIEEETKFKSRIFQLELKLSKLSGLKPEATPVSDSNLVGDDFHRLYAASFSKLSESESRSILRDYAQASGAIDATKLKYQKPKKHAAVPVEFLSEKLSKNLLNQIGLLPEFLVDTLKFNEAILNGSFLVKNSRQSMQLAIGIFLGLLSAVAIAGIRRFFQINFNRIFKESLD